jgi:competence protein ComEC
MLAGLAALAWLRPWRRALRLAGLMALLAVTSCLFTGSLAPRLRRTTQVVFLDVGQGDAAVIFAPGGQVWLVDAGGRLFEDPDHSADARLAARASDPGEQAVWRFLAARRVNHLDLVIISHPHPDHMGGLPALADHLHLDEVWLAGDDSGDPRMAPLLARLAGLGTRVVVPPMGLVRWAGDARLLVLGPGGARVQPSHPGENDDSLVVRLDAGGHRVLFTGDLEAPGEADLLAAHGAEVGAEVIKVPHHGSGTSSTPELVRAVHPRWAIISAGAGNRFGFPAAAVVERWRAGGAQVLLTAASGAISIDLGPGRLAPRTFVP